MKTAVSIPDPVFRSAEKLAARLGMSRSQLYAEALAAMLAKHSEALVTAQLNEIYGSDEDDSSLDPEVALVQQRSVLEEKW